MKINRQVNELNLKMSEDKLIHNVFDRIEHKKQRNVLSIPKLSIYIVTLVTLVIVFFSYFGIETPPIDVQVELSEYDTVKIAELTYLSGSLIGSNINIYNENLLFLSTNDETEFEANQEEINIYFDMLRVYLNGDLSEMIAVTKLTDGEYQYKIEFTQENQVYTFLLKIVDENIEGILEVGTLSFTVNGIFEKTDAATKLELEAYDGDNVVKITYRYENEDEIESKYEIETRINGVTSQREIKVSKENDESKVEIEEANASYELKKEIENGVVTYKLQYEIAGVEGEAQIKESIQNGVVTYVYSIKEGDVEKEIEHGRPNYKFDDDDEDQQNSGKNDDQFSGNNQSNKVIPNKLIVIF